VNNKVDESQVFLLLWTIPLFFMGLIIINLEYIYINSNEGCHLGALGSCLGRFMWIWWWTKWRWNSFFFWSLRFSLVNIFPLYLYLSLSVMYGLYELAQM
jgi:hypothetical protein